MSTAALIACSGCMSLTEHIPSKAPGVYAGVREDARTVVEGGVLKTDYAAIDMGPWVHAGAVFFAIIDFPFSAALDTVLLPIDLTYRGPPPYRVPASKE